MTALAAAVDVDDLRIAFSDGSLTTLKIVLGAILFGIALDTPLASFRAALRRPGVIAIGVVAQFLLLPTLTFLLSLAIGVRGSAAWGEVTAGAARACRAAGSPGGPRSRRRAAGGTRWSAPDRRPGRAPGRRGRR